MIAAAVLLCAWAGPASPQGADPPLKVEASITPLRLTRGQEGKVLLKINIKPGFFISPHPAFKIEFSDNQDLVFSKSFYQASDLAIEIVEENGREALNLIRPIAVPFTVGPRARRGIHVLEGRVRYFAGARDESWGLKSSARFSATYSTRIAAVEPKDDQIQR